MRPLVALYTHKVATIFHQPDLNALVVVWNKGVVRSEDYRHLWRTATNFAEKYKVQHWLNNETDLEAVSPQDLKWALDEWFPDSVARLGMKRRVALVVSKRFYTEMGTSNLIQTFGRQGEEAIFKRFKDTEEAFAWLGQED
jgi:hypothetical protein